MADQSYKVAGIYAEYVKMRQSGDSRDDAARVLMPQADELTVAERRQLAQLVQGWETTEGQFFKPFGKPSKVVAPPPAPHPSDSAHVSNAARAAAKATTEEATETKDVTAREARSGDHQAQRLLAKYEAAQTR